LLANTELDLDNEPVARALWEDAVQQLRAVDEPLQLTHKVRHLGDLHRRAQRLDAADACYAEALDLLEAHEVSTSADLANLLRRLAILREAQGASEQARAFWQRALTAYAALELAAGVQEAQERLAR